jgi:hypothetical protein
MLRLSDLKSVRFRRTIMPQIGNQYTLQLLYLKKGSLCPFVPLQSPTQISLNNDNQQNNNNEIIVNKLCVQRMIYN